ncbi:TIGR03747 family integrating conjugative element membrane protein [Corticibacter populi]|uniref:TIGR03747 family integrating conjugative element membrane protein n=2 Tax=Corticibacter populi TaxID=1550736 RepID=A0A3M6R0Z7_9BURK|nr:TIGR03747 family integrating conjugative element membrane protein [Corticibacter populi]
MAAAQSRPIQPQSRGPISIVLEIAMGLVFMSLFSIFVGTIIEIAGSYTFWKAEGLGHAQRIVQQDLHYIEQAPRSILVRDTVSFSKRLIERVRFPYERLGILRWYQSSHSTTGVGDLLQGQSSGTRQVRAGVDRASATASRMFAHIAVTSMYVAQDVFLRLAIAVFALPAFALACLVGVVDGMVKRDLRRWQGGRESSFVYHHAKRYTKWALTAGFGFYLTWPFGGINPTWMVLIFTVLVAFTLSVTVASFKKYV